MSNRTVSRRVFLERLGACAAGSAALSQLANRRAKASTNGWAAPPVVNTPNILIILVDQMRWPSSLSSAQLSTLNSLYLPNIVGQLRNNSYVFQQYYAAATACTPSRATLLTGLYAPQTAMYTTQTSPNAPSLVPAYPTWGWALPYLNAAYAGNVWWFGKWHLSEFGIPTSSPLAPYGFNTRNYPGNNNPSPDGVANEGVNGGVNTVPGPYLGTTFASDAQIAGDFTAWLTKGMGPWCATVSLINPHDIAYAANWLPPAPYPPAYTNGAVAYYPQPQFPPPFMPTGTQPLFPSGVLPTNWNWENQMNPSAKNYVGNIKPSLQAEFITSWNKGFGSVTDWSNFLSQYYFLQSYVDQQVGNVLAAVKTQGYTNNTVVIFASDHGDFGGSHGMHDKAFAAYEEAIHVPLYVHFPNQTGTTAMNQMCSSVDFFGLICDLATSGGAQWKSDFPDLAPRQSIWSFLYNNTAETRVSQNLGIPYVLHTSDESTANEQGPLVGNLNHIVCLRGKYNPANTAQPGAKLAIYSEWAQCTTFPDSTTPQYEFYDYNPSTVNNLGERGNDYFSTNPTTQGTIAQYESALGSWSSATGIIGSELNATLTGTGTNSLPLTQAQATARQNYFTYLYGSGVCSS